MDKKQIKLEMQNSLLQCHNIKDIEIKLQEVIENHYEGCWWEHTQYNIFMELLACNGLLMDIMLFIDKLVNDLH